MIRDLGELLTGPEERLMAHVMGLVIGGEPVFRDERRDVGLVRPVPGGAEVDRRKAIVLERYDAFGNAYLSALQEVEELKSFLGGNTPPPLPNA